MVLKDYDLLQLNAAYLHGLKERDPEALAVLSEKLLNDSPPGIRLFPIKSLLQITEVPGRLIRKTYGYDQSQV